MANNPYYISIDSDVLRDLARVCQDRIQVIESALNRISRLSNVAQVFGSPAQQLFFSNALTELKNKLGNADARADKMMKTLYGFADAFDDMANSYSQRAKGITNKMSSSISISSSDGDNVLVTYIPQNTSAPEINETTTNTETSKQLAGIKGFISWIKNIFSTIFNWRKKENENIWDKFFPRS